MTFPQKLHLSSSIEINKKKPKLSHKREVATKTMSQTFELTQLLVMCINEAFAKTCTQYPFVATGIIIKINMKNISKTIISGN